MHVLFWFAGQPLRVARKYIDFYHNYLILISNRFYIEHLYRHAYRQGTPARASRSSASRYCNRCRIAQTGATVAAREGVPILILTRRIGEALRIGDEVTVTVLGVKTGKQVSLGIRAPRSVAVHREELFNQIAQDQLTPSEPTIPDPVKPTVKVVIRNKKRQRARTEAGD